MIRSRKECGRLLRWIHYSSPPVRNSSSTANSWTSDSTQYRLSSQNTLNASTLVHRFSTLSTVQAQVEADLAVSKNAVTAFDHANSNTISLLKRSYETRSPTDAPQSADLLLDELRDHRVQPSIEALFWAVECWSLTKRKGSEVRLEALVQEMRECWKEEISKQSNEEVKATNVLIQIAMLRLCKAYHRACNAHRAEELLLEFSADYANFQHDDNSEHFRRPPPPTLEMCRSVLAAWSRSDSSRRAARAERLLIRMEDDPVLPRPDLAAYTSVLNCWASSRKEQAPQRAERLLRRMEKKSIYGGSTDNIQRPEITPNVRSYTCVINAWSRSTRNDAPEQAERLLKEMMDQKGLQPDRMVYTAMISTWGRSNRKNSVDKVEHYFQAAKDLESLIQKTTLDNDMNQSFYRASTVEYTATIQAWADYVAHNVQESRRAADRAEELLEELLREDAFSKAGTSGDGSRRPNRLTFAAVLKTIHAARRIPDRKGRADAVLRKMQTVDLQPNAYILSLVQKCAKGGDGPSSKNSKRQENKRRGGERH